MLRIFGFRNRPQIVRDILVVAHDVDEATHLIARLCRFNGVIDASVIHDRTDETMHHANRQSSTTAQSLRSILAGNLVGELQQDHSRRKPFHRYTPMEYMRLQTMGKLADDLPGEYRVRPVRIT